jgi:prepilin-type N-terminal cleavage/methylation domain-containing protein
MCKSCPYRSYLKKVFIFGCRAIDQRGLTLLEVLIALFVATIGLLSLSSMQISAIRGNGLSRECTQATFLAQSILERIKDGNGVADGTFGFIDMSGTDAGIIIDSGAKDGIDGRGDRGGPFKVQWQVASNTAWSRKISVNVSWSSISGRARQVRIASVSRGDGK